MGQKIYFGNVEVFNPKTKERKTIENQLFKEKDSLNCPYLRGKIFRAMKAKERENWRITKLCFGTAKQVGETVH